MNTIGETGIRDGISTTLLIKKKIYYCLSTYKSMLVLTSQM